MPPLKCRTKKSVYLRRRAASSLERGKNQCIDCRLPSESTKVAISRFLRIKMQIVIFSYGVCVSPRLWVACNIVNELTPDVNLAAIT